MAQSPEEYHSKWVRGRLPHDFVDVTLERSIMFKAYKKDKGGLLLTVRHPTVVSVPCHCIHT